MPAGTFLEYKNSKLFYTKSGTGHKILLAFHGFGQDHHAFDALAQSLTEDYTLYAFDLYFHGKSEWGYREQPIEKLFWKAVMEKFMVENNITKFSLTGFSLGARFALATVEALAGQIEKLFLLAPDGLKRGFWFTLSTYPIALRKIFKSMVRHPSRFKLIVNTLHELRLMNRGLLKFAEHQMNTVEKRRKVYYSWVVFRHLSFDRNRLAQLVNEKCISVIIVIGKKDQVITTINVKAFLKQLKNGSLKMIDTGHTALLKDPALASVFRGEA